MTLCKISFFSSHPTWHTGDAKQVRVTDKEVLQNFPRLVGINHYDLRRGVSAGADPHQTGELVLLPQLSLLLLRDARERITRVNPEHGRFNTQKKCPDVYLELLLQFI